ncbi:hypothetical protein HID58_060993, partial [Brassica napus]
RQSIDESSLDRRVLTQPTSPHSTEESRHLTDESSLDRRVVTRSMSRHSTGESSLDRRVLSRPFCSHLTVLSPQDCSVITSRDESSLDRRVFSRSRLARSLAATHSLSRSTLPVTRLTLLRSLAVALLRSLNLLFAVTRLALSQSLGSDRSLAVTRIARNRQSIEESSLDRRVLTQPTSPHSTEELSFSRHLTDESSLDRRVVTRSTSRHSTGESSLDRRVLSRPFCSHLTVLSPHDCSVITSTDESSLDRRAFSRSRLARSLAATHSLSRSLSRGHSTRNSCGHSTRTLTVTRLAPCGHSTRSLRSLDSHSCGHSTRTLAVTRSSTLPVTRLALLRSLAVALLRSLNLLFAVTRLALSQSLGSDRSLAVTRIALVNRSTSRQSIDESSLDRRVLTQPTSPHSTEESSLDRSLRVVSIRFKLSMKTSPNPTDESSSRLFTSLLTVLGSNTAFHQSSSSLNAKSLPRPSVDIRAVLICDDDVEVDKKSLEFALSVWKSNPDRLIGAWRRENDTVIAIKNLSNAGFNNWDELILRSWILACVPTLSLAPVEADPELLTHPVYPVLLTYPELIDAAVIP